MKIMLCNESCMAECMDGRHVAGGFFLFLVLGFVTGVLLCVAFVKFVHWMRGKSLVFVPWPRVLLQR